MKKVLFLLICAGMIVYSCSVKEKTITQKKDDIQKVSDTIRLALGSDEDVEHEIIIFEPGFTAWLIGYARPRDYYSQQFLEGRNRIYVTEWNIRCIEPSRYDANLYQQQINYRNNVDYGYEVNYQLYYYFIFFQQKYKQKLAAFPARL
ncbi:hypothetical protein KORDIASMS9_03853 [Kordia sp. SMS9]|uniref:DUF6146 family protein n=1 Tax=Kordia sp. SMS9 TaxID=2282170 RepID=UPI000E105262|nr:DUF6146 family protein [Kordia sp. SMS9]AXG71596.1 hypothetical protein KORDIASMS9_03853 [Kordia sp. SMS9]